MSIRVMSNVWELSEQRGAPLLVLLALADWANDRGECDPSYSQLAKKARVDRRRAVRIVQGLEQSGDLEREIGAGFTYAKGATSNRLVLRRYVDPSGARATTPVVPVPLPLVAPVPPTTVNGNGQRQQDIAASTDDAAVAADPSPPESLVADGPASQNGTADQPSRNGTGTPNVVEVTPAAAGKVSQADIRGMVEAMAAARGYPPANFARHTRAAKRLINLGHTPGDVTRTVAYIRRECAHLNGQPLTMETVSKYIGIAAPIRLAPTPGEPRELPDWIAA